MPRFAHNFRFAFRSFFAAFLLCGIASLALAQSVYWQPSSGTLGVGQGVQLSLVFENCQPTEATPSLPAVDALNLGQPSVSQQTSIVNFSSTSRTVFTYPAIATQRGSLTIPSFEIETDKGKVLVEAVRFEVGEPTVGGSRIRVRDVAQSELLPSNKEPWEGEVIDLTYRIAIARRANPRNVGPIQWKAPDSFVVDDWVKERQIDVPGAQPAVGIETNTRGYAKSGDALVLPPVQQMIALEVGSDPMGGFFSVPKIEQFLVPSNSPSLKVRPLSKPAPAAFLKAVGEFSFEARVVPTTATVGEPITWTLKLSGRGNWPENLSLPARELSTDFQALKPQKQRTMKDGTFFEGELTEDVVLIPKKPGTYTLGPITYTHFDPKKGTYLTTRTEAVTVTILPAAPVSDVSPAARASENANDISLKPMLEETEQRARDLEPPSPPTRALRDPLPEKKSVRLPWSPPQWGWAALPFALVPIALLGFALARVLRGDRNRAQRRAAKKLNEAVQKVASAPTDRAALREWQNVVAAAHGLKTAAPLPEDFSGEDAAAWRQLWSESETALYAPAGKLPSDWPARAAAAAAKVRGPGRPWFAALRLSNLWPAALLALVFLSVPTDVFAERLPISPEAVYNGGRFSEAEKLWAEAVKKSPGDWAARHNLGLALAQQNRWSEAAVQWSAAMLSQPRNESVRWHLALALSRADFSQPEMLALVEGQRLARIAREASPAEWQAAVFCAAACGALALVVLIANRHSRPRRWRAFIAGTLFAAAVLLAASATLALRVYGPLANPAAVLVWKATELRTIPTDAGDAQSQPLAAGSIAIADKNFLGWERLVFADGQTGWVRREALTFLYR